MCRGASSVLCSSQGASRASTNNNTYSNTHSNTDVRAGRANTDSHSNISINADTNRQVELCILSEVFKVELAAVDIQSGRVDVYGEGAGHARRGYMLFSGIHFDAVVFAAGAGGAGRGAGGGAGERVVRATGSSAAAEAVRVLAARLPARSFYTRHTHTSHPHVTPCPPAPFT